MTDVSKLASLLNQRKRVVDVRDYGVTDFTGATDQSAALQAAFDAAFTLKRPVYIQQGTIGLNAQVVAKAPILAAGHGPRSFYKTPLYGTRFLNLGGINSGQAMLLIDSDAVGSETARGWWCDGFTVDGGGFSCIGLQAQGLLGTNLFTRALLRRVFVTGCTTGLDLNGFTYTLEDCYAIENTSVGLLLRQANSVQIIGGEYSPANSLTSWAIRVLVAGNLAMRTNVQGELGAFGNGIDIAEGVTNVEIGAYLEHMAGNASTVGYHARVGAISAAGGSPTNLIQNAARNITFSYTVSSADTSSITGALGPRILLGNVVGVDLGVMALTTKSLEISQYARDISGAVVGAVIDNGGSGATLNYSASAYVTDETGMVGRPARSWIPNPSGRGSSGAAIRGYKEITPNALTIAAETTITRGDGASIRVTRAAATAGTVANVAFYPYGQEELIAQKGTAILTGWIYVPSGADGSANDAFKAKGSTNLRFPRIGFVTDASPFRWTYALAGGASPNNVGYYALNGWTRFFCAKPMADFGSITKLGWVVQPINDTAPVISGSAQDHSVYIADVALCVSPQSWNDVMAGRFSLAHEAGIFIGQNFHVYDSAAPTDADTYWLRGDVVWNTAPSAGGSPGWVCTTSGAGGTAVFRNMAALA